MDESHSQKGRTEEQFVNFYLSSAVPFCYYPVHPSLSLYHWVPLCVLWAERKKDNIHVLQKKNKHRLNLHIFLAEFTLTVFLTSSQQKWKDGLCILMMLSICQLMITSWIIQPYFVVCFDEQMHK